MSPGVPSPEFALRCAEHVLHIFESQYPDDAGPRKAIETAHAFLVGKAAARDAQAASRAAARAARSAYAAADFSEDVGYAKKFAAAYAAYAVDAAVYAAAYATIETATLCANNAAVWAANAANAADGADALTAVSDSVEPARWILEQLDGAVLTQAGNLPRALALAADARYDWFDLKPRFTVRNEHDLIELAEIHRFARSARLVLRRGRRLGLTKTGRDMLDDPSRFTTTLLRYMFDRSDIDGDASIVKATMMLAATPPSAEQMRDGVQDFLGRRWRSSDPNATFKYTTSHLVRIGRAFDWVKRDQPTRLTPLGQTAALTGLRLLLTGPVNSLV